MEKKGKNVQQQQQQQQKNKSLTKNLSLNQTKKEASLVVQKETLTTYYFNYISLRNSIPRALFKHIYRLFMGLKVQNQQPKYGNKLLLFFHDRLIVERNIYIYCILMP